ncbi:MAG: hypothetical protein ACOH1T_01635 [Microbacteriaceae bacterium]
MTEPTDTVEFPDPVANPAAHPLDLPAARADFVRSFLIRALLSPGLALVAAGLTWFVDENWARPVIVFVATALLGWLASQYFLRRAWQGIPRGRSDLTRALPIRWEFARVMLLASLLSTGVFVISHRLSDAAITDEVRLVTLGAALAAAVMSVIALLYALLRSGGDRRAALLSVPPTLALFASIAIASPRLVGETAVIDWSTVGLGAAMMLLVGAGACVWKLTEGRRAALG